MTRNCRRRCALLALSLTVVAAVATGCEDSPAPMIDEDVTEMDLSALPTLKQTKAQMLDLIDQVQAAVAAEVPATAPWRWVDEWDTGGCPDQPAADGIMLLFPNLVTERALTDPEWNLLFPTFQRLASATGLTETAVPQDSAGNHDARFSSSDGRTLVVISATAIVLSATVSCRREGGEPIRVDGAIPMPPNPQP